MIRSSKPPCAVTLKDNSGNHDLLKSIGLVVLLRQIYKICAVIMAHFMVLLRKSDYRVQLRIQVQLATLK